VNPETNATVAQVATKLHDNLSNFSQDTLISIYKQFPFFAYSIFGITYGQIFGAIVIFFIVIFLRPLFVSFLTKILLNITAKTETKYDDRIVKAISKPLKFAILIFAIYLFFTILYIDNNIINLILSSLLIVDIFWFILNIVDAIKGIIYKATSKIDKELSDSLSKFIIRVIKVLIWVIGISSVLSLWGINVTALIASLGIGGLAFALAAKDTAANLFGSIAILVDKSIKIGDWIKVNGIEGHVEDIGMRTTKIRTFYKSLVIVPNQIIANSNIENFSRRNKRRILLRLGLTYDTTIEQIEAILKDIKQMLTTHPNIAQDETMLVNFDNFGDSAKELFIYTFTNTAVWSDYLKIKEDVQFKIEQIVIKHGSGFAFPSQSLYIESLPK